jgi:hypothetical protein
MASNPATPFPGENASMRVIAAAASGAVKLDAQCSSHKSKYFRANTFSASPSFAELVTSESILFCAAK